MTENLRYDLRGLYDEGKRGIGSRNDGSTFEMTDVNLVSGVSYYTATANANNAVITPNTKSMNVTRYSYSGNATGTEYYYTWTAATAGQGSTANATSNTSVDGSICPAGWRLPVNYTDTANQNISWSSITDAYLGFTTNTYTNTGYQTLEQTPINLYRAGIILSGSPSQFDVSYGRYWSSTVSNTNLGYHILYDTSYVGPQDQDYKYRGFTVRCLANPS